MGWLGHGAVAVIALSSSALGATATFDDLASDSLAHAVPAGYRGLTWTNFFYQRASALPPGSSGAGFTNGLVSGEFVGFSNALEESATISSDAPFTFNSAYLTAARTTGLRVDVAGFDTGGAQVFDRLVTVDPSAASHVVFDWADVSKVVFTYQDEFTVGQNFVVDDLVINAGAAVAAPLPGAAGAGLVLWAMVMARGAVRRTRSESPGRAAL